MKKQILLGIFLTVNAYGSLAQDNNVGIGTTTPDQSSVLDVSSTEKGMLVPRLNSIQRLGILSPAQGLLVYDTDIDCFFFYNAASSTWQS
ncbi:MAG: hypothetical protein K9J17_01265, partial [Flavobacteriales bacterium]|nr:hypothetical protein [Flavobacteriales bacterium]